MGEVLTVYLIITLVSSIVYGIIFGKATNAVIANKGYDEDWFWWGFFFGIIAFIVALTKPQNPYQEEKASAWTAERAEEEKQEEVQEKAKPQEVSDDKFQEVKRYKELLDSGIITEEEFNEQ